MRSGGLPCSFLPWFFGMKPKKKLVTRSVLLVLASLSSPVCIITLPLFFYRAYIYKEFNSEKILALIALVSALVQACILKSTQGISSTMYQPEFNYLIIDKFFGGFVVGNIFPGYISIAGWLLAVLS